MRKANELMLDAATKADAAEISDVYLASRADALPDVRRVHTDVMVRDWIRDVLLERHETWVARLDRRIVGFATLAGDHLDQLYLLPGYYRHGIGRHLLDLAKSHRSKGLQLFTFQCNTRARAFYESQGFRIVDMNDGGRNEENEPDILYRWLPED